MNRVPTYKDKDIAHCSPIYIWEIYHRLESNHSGQLQFMIYQNKLIFTEKFKIYQYQMVKK